MGLLSQFFGPGIDDAQTTAVIASEAKQSMYPRTKRGLLRRYRSSQ
jgi:hypothetical protein